MHLCICTFVPTAHAEVIDRILAVVSGRPIMLSDVTAARDLGLVSSGGRNDVIGTILGSLIDRSLMLTEVERFVPPEPAPAAVEGRIEAVRARFTTPLAYEAALARSGIDEAQLRETIRDNLRIQAYLDLRFTVPPPTDEDVERFYREHLDAFAENGQTPPLAEVRQRVVDVMNAARRQSLVDDWVDGLRRRADIVNLYVAAAGTGQAG